MRDCGTCVSVVTDWIARILYDIFSILYDIL